MKLEPLRPNFASNCIAYLLYSFFFNSVFEAYLGTVNVISQRIFRLIYQKFSHNVKYNRAMH